MNRSNFFFILLLVCVSSHQIDSLIDIETDLDNVPAFVELANHPISVAFFSAASLRMKEEKGREGFQKIVGLINELIRDNKNQILRINKINARVEGQCFITTHKFKDRSVFFNGQTNYFKTRAKVAVEEKGEALNIMNSRNAQVKAYNALQTAAKLKHQRQSQKWGNRVQRGVDAMKRVNVALTAVNDWNPNTSHAFIQQAIKDSIDLFVQVKKFPLSVPDQLIQLAANDNQIRHRLFEWLNMLKASIQHALVFAQESVKNINDMQNSYDATLTKLQGALGNDSKKLEFAIQNYSTLIKVYEENEKIYTNLASQNALLIAANTKWCDQERQNFTSNKKAMEDQLKVFEDLRLWLRKNYGRVRDWLRKKYNH
jgi:hypothetical protein